MITIANHKQALKEQKESLTTTFSQKRNIRSITRQLIGLTDYFLTQLFHEATLHAEQMFCLVGLGSYGRQELQLHSDIDLLLLHKEALSPSQQTLAQQFVQHCWDIGLEIRHQITSVENCSNLAQIDLSVISSILDMRFIAGNDAFMTELRYQTHPLHMWSSHDFFFAKQQEQIQRYEKYDATAYNLEPNVKYGPGGLRDIQILVSIHKRHSGPSTLTEGMHYGFLTEKEYDELMRCQYYLWKIRFALHMIAGKREDRLLFEYQQKLAAFLGFRDNETSLAIEQFMKTYFNVTKRTRELNEILLQWFSETIIHQQKQQLTPLDDYFQRANEVIEIRHPHLFAQKPHTLLLLFLWIAKDASIRTVRASTVRLIRQHLRVIDKPFRASPHHQHLFLSILREKNPYEALQRMSQYGVLGHYLDCFAAVTGQMQYDLFHIYTVEQHTLFVIRNLARFLDAQYKTAFPLCTQIMPTLPKRDILYLAALFHDIAKGRGGDHSDLGAKDAEKFASHHQLSAEDQQLLVWLVQHHLLMSKTAQRQDIYDPKVIHHFVHYLPQAYYLDYLYLLTVADICGTNPQLWNTWKDSLLKELYYAAQHALQQEKKRLDEKALIHIRKEQALKQLTTTNLDPSIINALWQHIKGSYFLHETPAIIAAHTQHILHCTRFPLVMILPHHNQGGTEIFIYMPHRDERFTIATTVLSNLHLTIHEARIYSQELGFRQGAHKRGEGVYMQYMTEAERMCNTAENSSAQSISSTKHYFDMDTYIVLDEHNQALLPEKHHTAIKEALIHHLTSVNVPHITQRRLSRTQAHFERLPQLTWSEDHERELTELFFVAADRPGLLANISRVFLDEHIILHSAKIATAGERVEDMFYMSNKEGKQLTPEEKERLGLRLQTIYTSRVPINSSSK